MLQCMSRVVLHEEPMTDDCERSLPAIIAHLAVLLCNAVVCPHLKRSGMNTACSRSASAHLYHTDGRLTSCDGAVTDCI